MVWGIESRVAKWIHCIVLAGGICVSSACYSQNSMRGPVVSGRSEEPNRYGRGESGVLSIYQRWLSPVRGLAACPMYPSCSQYARIATERFGPLIGYVLGCERLMRCGHEPGLYRHVIRDGIMVLYDPVPER
jgi:putative component of membrane protein insertase Oxa1/YidC/SpoIIIJ protein YidD